jgi:putative phosphoesterase
MAKIGLISDSHGYIGQDAWKYLEECDEVWHAGDTGDLATLHKLEEFPHSRMVYGNIDGSDIRISCPADLLFVSEGVKVFMTHIGGYPGRYTKRVYDILRREKPDLYICGHSHILKIMRDRNLDLLHMNPGAIGFKGFHKFRTLILFELERGSISEVKAVDLGPRGRIITDDQ